MKNQDMLQVAYVIDTIHQSVNTTDFNNYKLKGIYQAIEQAYTFSQEPYSILEGSDVIPAFILNNWTFREDLESNLKNLRELSAYIRNTFIPPTGIQINKDQLNTMFNLADTKYSLVSRLLAETPIDILFVENTCHNSNALYYYNSNPLCKKREIIVITYSRDNRVQPEFSFLHELGHMVHTRVTQQVLTAPKSFDTMHNIIYEYSGIHPNKVQKKAEKRWLAEWFAECFAIAVLHGSPYESLDYHTDISNADKEEIQTYIDVLMSTLQHNKNGECTWDKLKQYYKET